MSLNKDLVERFRTLHHKRFGEYIEYQDAEHRLKELAELVRLLAPAYEEKGLQNE